MVTDKELIRLLKSDEQAGFQAVIEIYSAYVWKIALTRLDGAGSQEDIEETVSDVFVDLLRSGRVRGYEINSVKAFLSVIAKRRCADALDRLTGSSRNASLEEVPEITAETTSSAEERLALISALKALGRIDEEIFVRKYFIGQRSADIAEDMHMKVNTVDKRISRGLVKLRKMLKEDQQ